MPIEITLKLNPEDYSEGSKGPVISPKPIRPIFGQTDDPAKVSEGSKLMSEQENARPAVRERLQKMPLHMLMLEKEELINEIQLRRSRVDKNVSI